MEIFLKNLGEDRVSLTRTPMEKTPLSLVSSTYPITLAKKSRFSLPVFNVLY